ncbi:unnamed protein product [Rotaria sp. Silwood2]|nr:unnamed protein product [Rotaria sp. Silwood2]
MTDFLNIFHFYSCIYLLDMHQDSIDSNTSMLQLKMSRRRSSKLLKSTYDNRYDDIIEGDEEIFISLAAFQRLNDTL